MICAHSNVIVYCDVMICAHSNVIVYCDAMICAHSNVIVYCDAMICAHSNVIVYCDAVICAHSNVCTHFHVMKKKLVDSQNGFRKDSSCADNLSTLAEIVNTRKQRGLSTYESFIDFSKAFDRVDHNMLWWKLEKIGVSEKCIVLSNQFIAMYSAQLD